MITEDYLSFETAKLLKEKGFDGQCHMSIGKDEQGEILAKGTDWDDSFIPCPTIQIAMKWLRQVHNYVISICLDSYVEPYDNQYYIVIRRRKDKYEEVSPCEQVFFDTYEKACEAAIKYCLENLI